MAPPDLPLSPMPVALIPRPGILPMTDASEAELRERLVAEALSWVGTPYRQLGATKGVAIDCSMLLVRVMIDAGIVEEFDPRPYPPNWFLHRDDERYVDWMGTIAAEVETPKPGDIVLFRMGRAFAHSGFIVDDDHLLHAFADERQCNRSLLSLPILRYADRRGQTLRQRKFFDFFARLRGVA
jgi:cell wall-associated NlpC family hydrolase